MPKNINPKRVYQKAEIVAGVAAGLSCSLARVLCQIFSPSTEILMGTLVVIVNSIGILSSIGIVALFYKAYLIKKYNITDIEDKGKESDNGHQDIA